MAVLAAFQIELVLRQLAVEAVQVEAAGAAAAAAQEGADRSALAGVTHGVAEHLVDLLLRRHPPVRVWGTVHPDELWQEEHVSGSAWQAWLFVLKKQLQLRWGQDEFGQWCYQFTLCMQTKAKTLLCILPCQMQVELQTGQAINM